MTANRPARDAIIVQLPFPSSANPHPAISRYYEAYSARFQQAFAEFFVPTDSLWELPLWTTHLAGMLEHLGVEPRFVDLSRSPAEVEDCVAALRRESREGSMLLFSPLAQNFDLATAVSRRLMAEGRRVVIGGNMADLVRPEDASHIHRGQLTIETLGQIVFGDGAFQRVSLNRAKRGRAEALSYRPSYGLLSHYKGRVPLLRLNASHGCLYDCKFCGDAWSRQLRVVSPEVLEYEVTQFEALFPESRLVYIGDKTFGQSREAVVNLLEVFARRPQYRFVVQTHVLNVNEELVETMKRLGVAVVEMGFETADADVLKASNKLVTKRSSDPYDYQAKIQMIARAGMKVVLNVLGGLPAERASSHEQTISFLESTTDAWLYNVYNFVPYPLTPYFPELEPRIHDWQFKNWREDAPPVFLPYEQTVEQSFDRFLEKVATVEKLVGGVRRHVVEKPSNKRSRSIVIEAGA